MQRSLALLVTNTDRSDFARRYPNDGLKVAAGLGVHRPDWTYRVYDCTEGEFPDSAQAHDGAIISGSPASVNDDLPWIGQTEALVRQLHALRVPCVGLCFGHQLIAKALGGKVQRAADWGLGVGHLQVHQPQAWMTPQQADLHLYAAHQDQVSQLPPGAQTVAGDDFCPVGAYTLGRHIFAVQLHPELSPEFMAALLDEIAPKMPAAVIARARQQLAHPVDSALFFRWLAQFFEQAWEAPT